MSSDNPPARGGSDDIYAGLDAKTRAELEGMEREARRVLAKLDVEFLIDHVEMDRDAVARLRELQKEFVKAEVAADKEAAEELGYREPEPSPDRKEIEAAAEQPAEADEVEEPDEEVEKPDHDVEETQRRAHRPGGRLAP